MKSKSKRYQKVQKLFSVALLTCLFFGSSQLAADFDFFAESPDIFTQLEFNKPELKNNLIDSKRSRPSQNTRAKIRFSLDQATRRARSQSGGRVIKAQTTWRNGQPVHIIRVLSDDQRVKTYRYDGVSGRRL